MDVQVHPGEWDKYASPPLQDQSFARTRAPMKIFLSEARSHGIRAVHLEAPLKAGSPGAFLPDDYHLSPQGHRIIAEALSATLKMGQRTSASVSPSLLPSNQELRQ